MSTTMQIAFYLYFIGIVLVAAFGVVYATKREYMPYHAAALGISWPELSHNFKALILALMKAIGGLCFAVVFLELVLLFGPFKQGVAWAIWAIPAGGLLVSAASIYGMAYIAKHTPTSPPWALPIICSLLFITGLCFSWA